MSRRSNQAWAHIALLVLPLSLSACGGGGSTTTVGGTVSGLPALDGDSIELLNNGGDKITISSDRDFTFPGLLRNGDDYDVTVTKQPVGETCTVSKGSGRINHLSDAVDDVAVTCVATSSVGGTITGLAASTSITLLDTYTGGTQTYDVTANGWFAFPGLVPLAGKAYDVSVKTQPTGQTCTINSGAHGTGTTTAGVMVTVQVVCVAAPATE
jgi:hypothetical protein